MGRFVWSDPRDTHGGFSALELTADGLGFVALNDRGWISRGTLTRNAEGVVTGVDAPVLEKLPGVGTRGDDWSHVPDDSEGLARAPDGSLFVSFEGQHRVMRFPADGSAPVTLPRPEAFDAMITNAGLEALAIAPDGTLFTLPERSGLLARPFPVYRFRNGTWDQPFTLARSEGFLPVGADFGPDGRLYLLERRLDLPRGFASRVRRFDVTESGFARPVTLVETTAGTHDNLEGMAVWQDAGGRVRLTLISDDNFLFLQTTEIVDYMVPQ